MTLFAARKLYQAPLDGWWRLGPLAQNQSPVKIGLLYCLVQRWGVWGAIVSTLLSYSVEIFVLFMGVRGRFKFKFNALKLIIAPLLTGMIILLLEPWLGADFSWQLHTFYLIFCGVVLLWAYRNEVSIFKMDQLIK